MATFTKLTLALFVVLVIGSCMVDARARKRNRNNNNNNNNNAADRRARRMFKWYGPVESEEECTAEGKPEDLELQGEARPNSICTEDGERLCLCLGLRARRAERRENKGLEPKYRFKCGFCKMTWKLERKNKRRPGANPAEEEDQVEDDNEIDSLVDSLLLEYDE